MQFERASFILKITTA